MPKMGELYRVVNKERTEDLKNRYPEDSTYFSLFIEDESGDEEETILLTDVEVNKLSRVVLPELFTGRMVLGRCYTIMIGKRLSRLIRIKNERGDEYTVQVSDKVLAKGERRAAAHPKSLPKKSWLQDMTD